MEKELKRIEEQIGELFEFNDQIWKACFAVPPGIERHVALREIAANAVRLQRLAQEGRKLLDDCLLCDNKREIPDPNLNEDGPELDTLTELPMVPCFECRKDEHARYVSERTACSTSIS
jgi:hypothetical protein